MTREALNQSFLLTSFLDGANAAYIEDLQARYAANPGSVPDAWRHFFESLKEERGTVGADHREPAWATPLSKLQANGELVVALTGDYGEVERNLQSKISAHANQL